MKRKDFLRMLNKNKKRLVLGGTALALCFMVGCGCGSGEAVNSGSGSMGVSINSEELSVDYIEEPHSEIDDTLVNSTNVEEDVGIVEESDTTSEKDSSIGDSGKVDTGTKKDTPNRKGNGGTPSNTTECSNKVNTSENTSSGSSNNESTNTVTKPSNTGNGSSNSGSTNTVTKPSNTGNTSNNNKGNNSGTTTHAHNWVKNVEYIYHDEEGEYQEVLVKEAWTEEVPVYEKKTRAICNGCGLDITGNTSSHMETEMLKGNYACGGYHTETRKVQTGTEKVTHEAEYETKWVVTKEAWTEEVVSYNCSCGATK